MPTMIKVNCAHCGKEFDKSLKYFNTNEKNKHNHFCSITCCNLFKIKPLNYTCKLCGKQIYKKASTVKRSISGDVFCTRSCASSYHNSKRLGSDHPGFVHGVGSYRSAAFRSNAHKCAICGWDEDIRILEVHHIDENRYNNDDNNLIILCPNCHTKVSLKYYILADNNTKLVSK